MGGTGDNEYEKEEKIIQKISKNVIIEKDIIECMKAKFTICI